MTLAIDFAGFHVITGKHKEIQKKIDWPTAHMIWKENSKTEPCNASK